LSGSATEAIMTATESIHAEAASTRADPTSGTKPWQLLTARDVMVREIVTVRTHDNLAQAAIKMLELSVRHLPVLDAHRRLTGILSDRDLRCAVGDPEFLVDATQLRLRLDQRRVMDVMTRTPAVTDLNTPLEELARRLSEEKLGALLVIDQERRLLGIVSYVDVLRTMLTKP
jgi:CBS domain-containing protein